MPYPFGSWVKTQDQSGMDRIVFLIGCQTHLNYSSTLEKVHVLNVAVALLMVKSQSNQQRSKGHHHDHQCVSVGKSLHRCRQTGLPFPKTICHDGQSLLPSSMQRRVHPYGTLERWLSFRCIRIGKDQRQEYPDQSLQANANLQRSCHHHAYWDFFPLNRLADIREMLECVTEPCRA